MNPRERRWLPPSPDKHRLLFFLTSDSSSRASADCMPPAQNPPHRRPSSSLDHCSSILQHPEQKCINKERKINKKKSRQKVDETPTKKKKKNITVCAVYLATKNVFSHNSKLRDTVNGQATQPGKACRPLRLQFPVPHTLWSGVASRQVTPGRPAHPPHRLTARLPNSAELGSKESSPWRCWSRRGP